MGEKWDLHRICKGLAWEEWEKNGTYIGFARDLLGRYIEGNYREEKSDKTENSILSLNA